MRPSLPERSWLTNDLFQGNAICALAVTQISSKQLLTKFFLAF
jgi:hypothetical protein